jgi:hypothetical protein
MTVTKTRAALVLEPSRIAYAVARPSERAGYGFDSLMAAGSLELEIDGPRRAAAIWPSSLDRAARSLLDIIPGAAPYELTLVLHPSECVAVETDLPRGLAAEEQASRLLREGALLSTEPVRIAAVHRLDAAARPDREALYALFTTERDAAAISSFARSLGTISTVVASPAVVELGLPASEHATGRGVQLSSDPNRVCLVIGAYAGYTEYCVARLGSGRPLYVHAVPTRSEADRLYFAVSILRGGGFDIQDVAATRVYGDCVTEELRRQLSDVLPVVPFTGLLNGVRPEYSAPNQHDHLIPAIASLRTGPAREAGLPSWFYSRDPT